MTKKKQSVIDANNCNKKERDVILPKPKGEYSDFFKKHFSETEKPKNRIATVDISTDRKPYKEQLQHPKWQKKRLKIFERDEWKCTKCNDTETMLQVHHLEYTAKEAHLEPEENLTTLCKDCHGVIEYLKKGNDNEPVIEIRKKRLDDDHIYFFIRHTPGLHIVRLNYDEYNSAARISNRVVAEIAEWFKN